MLKFLIAFFLMVGVTEAGQLDALWIAPTTNTDGSPLQDLSLYRVYWRIGAPPCPGPIFVVKPSPTTTPLPNSTLTVNIPGLVQGTVYQASVTAVDLGGNESACSAVTSAPARPNPPTAPAASGIIFR